MLSLARPATIPRARAAETEPKGKSYHSFLCYCQLGNFQRIKFKEFKEIAKELILERYQLGFRHDIRTAEGRQTHGWKHIRLLPESATKAIEAA
jgi:hypothetical protein